jgi:energy-coupling factor transporter ATP-binding protein EcfA2
MTRLRIRELAWSPDGARPLLEGIELAVADGELVGLIGPNGSGKTSLLRCAYRFQRPSAGSVELDGEARRVRLLVFVVASLLTGVLVSLSGAIGFVGLMLPHVARLLVGAEQRRLLPVSALLGALFLVWVDVAARTWLAPQDLPIGIATAAIGGAFFVLLLRRR